MKTQSAVPQTTFDVDRRRNLPIHRQAYEWLRASITGGGFEPGSQLPATRALATELGISRTTVVRAYEQLLAEGYATGRVGSGTFVSEVLPDFYLQAARHKRRTIVAARARTFSRRGLMMAESKVTFQPSSGPIRAFRPGPPAIDAFPWELWLRLSTKVQRRAQRVVLGYPYTGGHGRLRAAIAAYLKVARDVRCEPEQVLIVPSAQLGLDFLCRILLDPGEEAWIEDPGFLGARNALRNAGAQLVPVPVDSKGMDVETGIRRAPSARLVYVTPSHQYPLGVTMSYPRRQALLQWARSAGAWVIEDDYDSEFRYVGQPLASLHGLDDGNRVIYLGTLSKVLFPALRLAYIIVPKRLTEPITAAMEVAGVDPSTLLQLILTEFIEDGHFVRHLRRMRQLYNDRQAVLLESASRELSGVLEMQRQDSGMRLVGWLPAQDDDSGASRLAERAGIEAPPLSAYCIEAKTPPALLLGYAAIPPREIRTAVRRLRGALSHRRR
jgi:GntR family transcriptional regulator/MocR family aminotransferase